MKELFWEIRKNYELQRMNRKPFPVLRAGISANAYTQDNETLYGNINAFLGQNPHIQEDIDRIHQFFPQHITMAVLENMNQSGEHNQSLVLARVRQDGLYCLLPKISCTMSAIRDLYQINMATGKKDMSSYHVAISEDNLRPQLFLHAERYPQNEHFFAYEDRRMDPQDYIALGVQGFLMGATHTISTVIEDKLFLLSV